MNDLRFFLSALIALSLLILLSTTSIEPLTNSGRLPFADPSPTVTPPPTSPTPAPRVEARPSLILAVRLLDAQTGAPVTADVFADEAVVGKNRRQYRLLFQPDAPGQFEVSLRFEAAGYQTWRQRLTYELLFSRTESLVVRLNPISDDESP